MYVAQRSSHNPILTPNHNRPWEALGAFNPSPVRRGSAVHMLYRALGLPDTLTGNISISTIGKAVAEDGIEFQSRKQLVVPEELWERYGCEDPRVTFFEGQYVIFYTALSGVPFSKDTIKVACAISPDLEQVTERHLVTPFNGKAMTLFPERVNGKVTVIFSMNTDDPPAKIMIAQCDRLEQLWDPAFWEAWRREGMGAPLDPRRTDRDHVEIGSQPLQTAAGWLVFYSYIQNYFGGGPRVFGIEALLLDAQDPRHIVGKTHGPIMVPEEVYEHYGMVPNVVFPSGATLEKNGIVDIYYGAADTVCAKMSLNVDDLLTAILLERVSFAERSAHNPILAPIAEHPWESKAVFNAAAIDIDDTIHLLYRAMGSDNTSVLGYATTKNGETITERLPEPAYVPREPFEMKRGSPNGNSGCEDPRITRIGSTLYMTYTAFDGIGPWRVALSSISVKDFVAKRFHAWTKPVLITPENVNDKNMCLFPEKIAGQYMIMHRIGNILCADFLPSLDFSKQGIRRCVEIMGPRAGMWDSQKIGIAGPPIKTEKGWVLIYHGISVNMTYRLGAVLLDLDDPTLVLSRTSDVILEPQESYEKQGQVHNVVFSCGVVRRKDTLLIYYGGGDTTLDVAKVSLKKLLKILSPKGMDL